MQRDSLDPWLWSGLGRKAQNIPEEEQLLDSVARCASSGLFVRLYVLVYHTGSRRLAGIDRVQSFTAPGLEGLQGSWHELQGLVRKKELLGGLWVSTVSTCAGSPVGQHAMERGAMVRARSSECWR